MKVSIIGVGRVGATLAYTLTLRGLADELVLVDEQPEVAEGEAPDLRHAEAFTSHRVSVRAGDAGATAHSDLLVLACSAPWQATYTSRFDLARENVRLFARLIPPLVEGSPQAKLLVITNPVDVMTYHALRISRFPATRVFGTGTLIDMPGFAPCCRPRWEFTPTTCGPTSWASMATASFPCSAWPKPAANGSNNSNKAKSPPDCRPKSADRATKWCIARDTAASPSAWPRPWWWKP